LDVITLDGGDLNVVSADWRFNKPVVVLDQPAGPVAAPASADTARIRMWETRMRGGYWVATAGSTAENSPEMQAAAACGRFFRQTRFWRLMPRPEMLGGREESDHDRLRREHAQDVARQAGQPLPAVLPNPTIGR